MRVENEPQNLNGTVDAAGLAGRQSTATSRVEQRLTQDEMSQLLDLAIARQAEAQQHGGDLATIADAVEVARQLGIPEEHVYAAAEELQRRRHIEQAEQASQEQRLYRRRVEKDRRRAGFLKALVPTAVLMALCAGVGVLTTQFVPALGAMALLGLPLLFLFLRWLSPVSEEDAAHTDPITKPGTCRVCGEPATTSRSTFCEEHRWRGPASS